MDKVSRNSRLSSLLADGLRGNNHLNAGNQEHLANVGALRENNGLVKLDLSFGRKVSDEMWATICDSLKLHPSLHRSSIFVQRQWMIRLRQQ
jgi:hypothetical protein